MPEMTTDELTIEGMNRIRTALGMNKSVFAKALGISRVTFYNWLRKGRMRSFKTSVVEKLKTLHQKADEITTEAVTARITRGIRLHLEPALLKRIAEAFDLPDEAWKTSDFDPAAERKPEDADTINVTIGLGEETFRLLYALGAYADETSRVSDDSGKG